MPAHSLTSSDSDRVSAPSLSLKDLRIRVESLNDRQKDVLAYILDGDAEIIKVSHITHMGNLEHYLSHIYRALGIIEELKSMEKRQAADLMYKIYDQEGFQLNPQQRDFLLGALGQIERRVTLAQSSGPQLRDLESVRDAIKNLKGSKTALVEWLVEGKSLDDILPLYQDGYSPGTNIDNLHNILGKLCEQLVGSSAYKDGEVLALIREACIRSKQPVATPEPVPPVEDLKPEPESELEPQSEPESGQGADPVLEPGPDVRPTTPAAEDTSDKAVSTSDELEKHINNLVVRNAHHAFSAVYCQIMDLVSEGLSNREIADQTGQTYGNVGVAINAIKVVADIPQAEHLLGKERFACERKFLGEVWKAFRRRNGQPAATEHHLVPEPVLDSVPPTPDSVPPVPDAVDESVQELVSDEVVPSDVERVTLPVPEPAPEPETELAITAEVPVIILWTHQKDYEKRIGELLAQGYEISQVNNFVEFHPEIVTTSAVVLRK